MVKKLLSTVLALSLTATIAFSADAVVYNVVNGDVEELYNDFIKNKIEDVGFSLSDPHLRINDAYKAKYGTKTLEDGKVNPQYDPEWKVTLNNLGFYSISNDMELRELLIKAPQLGGFSPFNFHAYKKIGEDKTYLAHIAPTAMLDIVGVQDKEVRTKFIEMFKPLDDLVQKEFGGKVEVSQYKALPEKKMMTYEITFKRPADLTDYLDEFQEEFEGAFEDAGYIIAGFHNFREVYMDEDLEFSKYDAYFVYSLCHFTYSYNMFNKGRPDAGVFAPCAMYMYIEKDSNKLVIGMPTMFDWTAIMNLKDETMVKSVNDLNAEITDVMLSLGAKEI
jgi:hypothetical protein